VVRNGREIEKGLKGRTSGRGSEVHKATPRSLGGLGEEQVGEKGKGGLTPSVGAALNHPGKCDRS